MKIIPLGAALALWAPALALGADERDEPRSRFSVYVQGDAPRFLPPVQGGKIFSGKKTTVTQLGERPTVTGPSHRQMMALVPGLLVSEVSNGSWGSFSYRGLGEPHETWNLLILKDGVPVSPDPYSYPAAYYLPPAEAVDRLSFVRGGAGLLYGPQPGGALNYETRLPRPDRPFSLLGRATYGSFNQVTAYAAASGTAGRLGYLADFSLGRSDGPRYENSDLLTLNGTLTLTLDAGRATRYLLRIDSYGGDFGEPGGLSRARYDEDRRQATTPADRFRARRHVGTLQVEHDFSPRTSLDLRAYGGYYERTSRRQAGTRFGERAPGENVSIVQRQTYAIVGAQGQLRHEWMGLGQRHTLAAGASLLVTDAPVAVRKGDSASDDEGRGGELSRAARGTAAGALFIENEFRVGRLRLVPGARVELIHQRVREDLDLQVGDVKGGGPGGQNGELGDKQSLAAVPLLGLGASLSLGRIGELYGNASRGYKPTLFNDGVAFQSGVNVAPTFAPSYSTTLEGGARGRPLPGVSYDTSVFFIELENQVGLLGQDGGGASRRNIGLVQNYGWDALLEVDPLSLLANLLRRERPLPHLGNLTLYGGVSLLSAQVKSGPAAGNRPQYAPPYTIRAGVVYRYRERVKVALAGNLVAAHSAVDNGHPLFDIPGYQVWDLTADVALWRDRVGVTGGLLNLFDEAYYARVRPGGGGGIDAAPGRTFYAGVFGRY